VVSYVVVYQGAVLLEFPFHSLGELTKGLQEKALLDETLGFVNPLGIEVDAHRIVPVILVFASRSHRQDPLIKVQVQQLHPDADLETGNLEGYLTLDRCTLPHSNLLR
jgi:hypothetical protein